MIFYLCQIFKDIPLLGSNNHITGKTNNHAQLKVWMCNLNVHFIYIVITKWKGLALNCKSSFEVSVVYVCKQLNAFYDK